MTRHFAVRMVLRVAMPVALALSALLIPFFDAPIPVGELLTVVSILFAILVGFFFVTATTNYIALKNLIAEEAAMLIALFNIGSIVKPSGRDRLRDAIDRYVIATLDFPLASYADGTTTEFQDLVGVVDDMRPEPDDVLAVELTSHFNEIKTTLWRVRQTATITAPRVIRPLHWFIIIMLALCLDMLLLSVRHDSWPAAAAVGVLVAASYFALIILHEIDGNHFLEEELAYADAQRVFRAIGRDAYYPAPAIASGAFRPSSGARYRVGTRNADGTHAIT